MQDEYESFSDRTTFATNQPSDYQLIKSIQLKTVLKKLLLGVSFVAGTLALFTACNSKADILYTLPSSATVSSFSLSNNDKILPNLDSVFFSIDLYSCEIFNADSLPYGTKVNKLVPVILTNSASVVELIVPANDSIEEQTINYLENTKDSIDFTNPVKLRVVSYDGANERNYTIRVNVHTVPTDTLVWKRLEKGTLPTVFNAVNRQHTAMSPSGKFYCMTSYQNEYAIAVTTNPAESWQSAKINIPFTPDINSLTATNDELFILDVNGKMYSSADNGLSWNDSGTVFEHLIGPYGNSLLATQKVSGNWNIAAYPSGDLVPAPAGFPVTNTSNSVCVSFEMSVSPQLFITGGRTADGSLSGDTWGFDGKNWANVSRTPIPEKIENLALVPYFDIVPDTVSWKVAKRSTVLLAMCGNISKGTPNDTVYISYDFGLRWKKAPESLQIPASVVPARTMAQAYPHTAIMTDGAKRARSLETSSFERIFTDWKPTGYVWPGAKDIVNSRASVPVEEWDVPYIYLFGGENAQGVTFNTVYRGVITAFTFKPLQ